jgi:hypothetical protein
LSVCSFNFSTNKKAPINPPPKKKIGDQCNIPVVFGQTVQFASACNWYNTIDLLIIKISVDQELEVIIMVFIYVHSISSLRKHGTVLSIDSEIDVTSVTSFPKKRALFTFFTKLNTPKVKKFN